MTNFKCRAADVGDRCSTMVSDVSDHLSCHRTADGETAAFCTRNEDLAYIMFRTTFNNPNVTHFSKNIL